MILSTIRANLLACVLGLAAAIFLVIAVVQSIQLNGFLWLDGANDKVERLTIDNNELRASAKEAERLNQEQVNRIVIEQDRISKDVEANLGARLERLRSELRSKAAPRNPASPKAGPDVPSPEGTDGEAGLCLAPEELLRGAESEERHDQLITLLEQMGMVER